MSENAVTDSACLIGLERIGRLDILSQSFNTVFIPSAVEKELGRSVDWLIVRPVQNKDTVTTLKTQIDEGEAEVIALAMELKDVYVVLDDKKARRIAQEIGLEVIGTIGVILRAKKKGIIAEIKPVLNKLEEVDFRISNTLYEQALQLAKEE